MECGNCTQTFSVHKTGLGGWPAIGMTHAPVRPHHSLADQGPPPFPPSLPPFPPLSPSPQLASLFANLHLLEQVGSHEMGRVFTRSERLNSEAIVDFVKALCKVRWGAWRCAR